MKAVLVIDEMPKTDCAECPLCVRSIDGWTCSPTKRELASEGKPTWCPLKPLQKKQELKKGRMTDGEEILEAYIFGYNACLEEIEDVDS